MNTAKGKRASRGDRGCLGMQVVIDTPYRKKNKHLGHVSVSRVWNSVEDCDGDMCTKQN